MLSIQKINGAMAKPKRVETTTAAHPGRINGWLNTYFPILVDPVSSISTAATVVGYVGRRYRPVTAGKEATMTAPDTPIAAATGMKVAVVAPWE